MPAWRRDEHLHRAGSATTPGDGHGPPEIGLWLVLPHLRARRSVAAHLATVVPPVRPRGPGLAGVELHDGSRGLLILHPSIPGIAPRSIKSSHAASLPFPDLSAARQRPLRAGKVLPLEHGPRKSLRDNAPKVYNRGTEVQVPVP